ncbi:hypothetical protein ACH4TC_18580 [Streptomyces spororaveus]|uniref:hypothetical protein n=1 Tax=Streptomyces spororaveus TaxID=284039 RepID=UPI00379FD7E4
MNAIARRLWNSGDLVLVNGNVARVRSVDFDHVRVAFEGEVFTRKVAKADLIPA